MVSTYAGNGQEGVVDAQRLFASFDEPFGIIIDQNDNIYVSEDGEVIRKIDNSGLVTTIAGIPGVEGLTDGNSRSSLFQGPSKMCFRADGSLIVADYWNHAIRSISPDLKTVTTIAGNGTYGSTNSNIGTLATFDEPVAVACDKNGNVYVGEDGSDLVYT